MLRTKKLGYRANPNSQFILTSAHVKYDDVIDSRNKVKHRDATILLNILIEHLNQIKKLSNNFCVRTVV